MIRLFSTLSALLMIAGCSSTPAGGEGGGENGGGTVEPVVKSDVEAYVTSQNLAYAFTQIATDYASVSMSTKKVTIDPSVKYQEIDGFGVAITGASCYNLLRMTAADRAALLKETFDPVDGKGFSFIRLHIGGSDFSMDEYTCCDKEGIENFAIPQIERDGIFPILKEILAINPEIKIMGSPWSCPRWMKVDPNTMRAPFNSWTSGRLNPLMYEDYALYFVKWVQAMEAEGFPIYAITMQNEPLNHGNSMSLYMPWEDQLELIKRLGPAFEKAGIKTKILLFDHNYNYDNVASQEHYPLNIYADTDAAKYADGSAWHNYGGSVSELDYIRRMAPDKSIYFTEASIGQWIGDGTWDGVFKSCLLNDFETNFLGVLSRWGKGVIMWNYMLDNDRKPYRPGGCSTCFGAVEISNKDYKTLRYSSHYYDVAHCSKVVKAGAVRVKSSGYTADGLVYEAFMNPDGSLAVLAMNKSAEDVTLAFQGPEKGFRFTLPAQSIASLRWNEKAE